MNTQHAWKRPTTVTAAEVLEAWDYMADVDGKDYTGHYGHSVSGMTPEATLQLVTDAHYTAAVRQRQGKE